MPCEPSMNWLKNVMLNPTNTNAHPILPQNSEYITPNILGHQWCNPPIMAMSAEPIIT